jgi:hypothetical protein
MTRIGVLEALGRKDHAQTLRFSMFEQHLSAQHLKTYIKQLGAFDDVKAERPALDQVERHANVHAALAFLINGPALNRAARVSMPASRRSTAISTSCLIRRPLLWRATTRWRRLCCGGV